LDISSSRYEIIYLTNEWKTEKVTPVRDLLVKSYLKNKFSAIKKPALAGWFLFSIEKKKSLDDF